jgi:hypothetical protein
VAYSRLAHNKGSGATSATTTAIDSTGANLIVIWVAWYFNLETFTLSDSASNTWTSLTKVSNSNGGRGQFFYCYNPTTSATHTVTASSGNNLYFAVCVAAYSGSTASPFDVENGASGTASTLATGNITPGFDNELVVAGGMTGDGGHTIDSINGGFTILDNVAAVGSATTGGALADLIQTTATTAGPTWTFSAAGTYNVAAIASFKAAAGGGGGGKAIPIFHRAARSFRRSF